MIIIVSMFCAFSAYDLKTQHGWQIGGVATLGDLSIFGGTPPQAVSHRTVLAIPLKFRG
jgi:hypothetical protein